MIKFYRATCGSDRLVGLVLFGRLLIGFFQNKDGGGFAVTYAHKPWRRIGAAMVTP